MGCTWPRHRGIHRGSHILKHGGIIAYQEQHWPLLVGGGDDNRSGFVAWDALASPRCLQTFASVFSLAFCLFSSHSTAFPVLPTSLLPIGFVDIETHAGPERYF